MAISALSPVSLQTFFDTVGNVVRPAKLYFYKPDTFDPVTVYRDQELSVPHEQPVVTGGSGRVPPIYISSVNYRVRIFDNANQLVEDVPWLPGAQASDGGGGGGVVTGGLETGDTVWRFANSGVRDGFVRLNGNSIGNSASGATERANDDAHALFIWLWGQDVGQQLAVTPTRGASAEGDWLANKRLALPDARGRALFGVTTMGTAASNRLDGASLLSGALGQPGALLGYATHTLTLAESPTHNHGVTDPGHTHGVNDPTHTHPVSQDAHNHTVRDPGHAHAVADPGHSHGVNDPGHDHSATQTAHSHAYTDYGYGNRAFAPGGVGSVGDGLAVRNAVTDSKAPTIDVKSRTTGISLGASGTGIGIYGSGTGIYLDASQPIVRMTAVATGVSVLAQTTGISTQNSGGGAAHNNMPPAILGTWYMKL